MTRMGKKQFDPFKIYSQFFSTTPLNHGSDIQKYVQSVLSQSIQPSVKNMLKNFRLNTNLFPLNQSFLQDYILQETPAKSPSSPLKHSIYNLHDHLVIHIPLNNSNLLKKLKFYFTSNQFIIKGYPAASDKEIITLPSLVKSKGAVSSYRNGILEIILPKKNESQYTEIDVQQF